MYLFLRYMLIAAIVLALYSAVMAVLTIPCMGVMVIVIIFVVVRKKYGRLTAFGNARWSEAADIPHLLEGNGLIVGHISDKPRKLKAAKTLFDFTVPCKEACERFLFSFKKNPPSKLVRLTDAIHTAVFAPTGTGKGVSCIVPFLLTTPESAVVIDPKGENYRLTADARRRMGQRVIRIDPFGVCGPGSDTFNVLQFIDRESPTALDDIRDLAQALVIRTGQERDPHWIDAAEIWIAAMTAAVVAFANEEDKNLQSVRSVLTDPQRMQATIKMMCESPDIWEGMLARTGHQLTQFADKELNSTLTSTNRFMRFLDTIAIANNTKESSFNPADLLTGRVTIYLILPPQHLRAQSGLLRLWIGGLLRSVVQEGLQEQTKVHFLLDEAASLGHLESLDDAVNVYRGYGIRLQLYYQSLGQLKQCWPEGQDQTLLSNVTQVFFGVNDQSTAEYVSARLGESTIILESGGSGTGTSRQSSSQGDVSHSSSTNASANWQQHGRKLLKPEEVTALHPRWAITFMPSLPPLATWLVRYYEQSFDTPQRMGMVRAVFDTLCFFLGATMFAALLTANAAVPRRNDVQTHQRVLQSTEGRPATGGSRSHTGSRRVP